MSWSEYGDGRVCGACVSALAKGRVPDISVQYGWVFNEVPPEVQKSGVLVAGFTQQISVEPPQPPHEPLVQMPLPQAAVAATQIPLEPQHPSRLQLLSAQHGWPVPPHAAHAPCSFLLNSRNVTSFNDWVQTWIAYTSYLARLTNASSTCQLRKKRCISNVPTGSIDRTSLR